MLLVKYLEENPGLEILNDGSSTRIYTKKSCPDITLCSAYYSDKVRWEVASDSSGSDYYPISIQIIVYYATW